MTYEALALPYKHARTPLGSDKPSPYAITVGPVAYAPPALFTIEATAVGSSVQLYPLPNRAARRLAARKSRR